MAMNPVSMVASSYPHCFACGSENRVGLHLAFTQDADGGSRADFVARPEHVGWPDVIHGGIVFTVLDEAAAWALTLQGLRGVTAKAEVRYRMPARAGVPMIVTSRIEQRLRRTVRTKSELREAATNAVVAELDATMFLVDSAAPAHPPVQE